MSYLFFVLKWFVLLYLQEKAMGYLNLSYLGTNLSLLWTQLILLSPGLSYFVAILSYTPLVSYPTLLKVEKAIRPLDKTHKDTGAYRGRELIGVGSATNGATPSSFQKMRPTFGDFLYILFQKSEIVNCLQSFPQWDWPIQFGSQSDGHKDQFAITMKIMAKSGQIPFDSCQIPFDSWLLKLKKGRYYHIYIDVTNLQKYQLSSRQSISRPETLQGDPI